MTQSFAQTSVAHFIRCCMLKGNNPVVFILFYFISKTLDFFLKIFVLFFFGVFSSGEQNEKTKRKKIAIAVVTTIQCVYNASV